MHPVATTFMLALAAMAGLVDRAFAAEGACSIAEQTGAVLVLHRGGAVLGTIGAALAAEDGIRTGTDAKVLLDCRGGLQLAIGPGSEVRLARYLAAADGSRLEVALGMAFGLMRLITGEPRPGRSIEVETRVAVASVRSTEWVIEAVPAATSVLSVHGRVEVRGSGTTVALDPGQGTEVMRGQPPTPSHIWGEARRARVLALTTL
jgi:hypothetical protein